MKLGGQDLRHSSMYGHVCTVIFQLAGCYCPVNPAVLKETISHLVELTLYVDLELSMLTVGQHKHGNTLSLFSKKLQYTTGTS